MLKLYKKIRRVIDFLPIIWKGYDWDYRYAIELFQYQLSRTAGEIEKKGYQVGRENTANRIRTAVKLMDKVYDEEYSLEYISKIEEKYGKYSLEFEELDELDKNGDPYYTMVERWKIDYTKDQLSIIEQEKNAMMWESRAKQKKAHRLLWNYIEHNIQRWWD